MEQNNDVIPTQKEVSEAKQIIEKALKGKGYVFKGEVEKIVENLVNMVERN